jgi:chaperonin cofactor prefoldin
MRVCLTLLFLAGATLLYPGSFGNAEDDSVIFITKEDAEKRRLRLEVLLSEKRDLLANMEKLKTEVDELKQDKQALKDEISEMNDSMVEVIDKLKEQTRVWKSAGGSTIVARLRDLDSDSDSVELVNPKGKVITVKREQLSRADQNYLYYLDDLVAKEFAIAEEEEAEQDKPVFGKVEIIREEVEVDLHQDP